MKGGGGVPGIYWGLRERLIFDARICETKFYSCVTCELAFLVAGLREDECCKRISKWSAYLFTSRKFPVSDQINISSIQRFKCHYMQNFEDLVMIKDLLVEKILLKIQEIAHIR